jgi:FemAB-related protein (PEP-CTERM system-associated)
MTTTADQRSFKTTTRVSLKTAAFEDRDAWNAFLGSSPPGAGLCHAHEWKTIIESAYSKTCHYLQAMDGEECVGVLPLVHMKGPLTGNRLVSVPFLDQGGPVARAEDVARMLWEACLELAAKVGARGIDLRGPLPRGDGTDAAKPSSRVTFTLPLPRDPGELWKSFTTKVRNQVRKAEKEGLSTAMVGPERLGAFYDVFCRNMRDLGSPVHGLRLFKAVFETFGDRARLYLTRDQSERVVGGGVAIEFGASVTVPWASSLREARPACPNHSLYWKILSDAVENGSGLFDFGRSRVGAGTYSFKKQWGAEARDLVWSSFNARGEPQEEHDYDPERHGRVVRAWKRLPVVVTKWIGPLLRRQLAN